MPAKKSVSPTKSISKTQASTATSFINKLKALEPKSPETNARYFADPDKKNKILGVRHAGIFALAKEFMAMPLNEVEKLLDNAYYEVRMGAVSIMDFQARDKKITPEQRKALYDLYIRQHDRINNWDMVDRSAPYVVGGYLADKPRKALYKLAKSKDPWERRTAIVSTYFFIRQNETTDTFAIAELLVKDEHDLVQKAVGSWLREAGKRDEKALIAFLDKHHRSMPRTMLRYAAEKLKPGEKARYPK